MCLKTDNNNNNKLSPPRPSSSSSKMVAGRSLSSPSTTSSSSSPSTTPSHPSMTKRLRLIVVVTALLMAEYFLQSMYYQRHNQQQSFNNYGGGSAWGSWFLLRANSNDANVAVTVVPKSDKYIAKLDLETCKFPIYYDQSRFDFKLSVEKSGGYFVEPGNWRQRNKRFVGNQDAKLVYNEVKRAEAIRKRMYNRNPNLPPIQRNLTFVHIGKAGGSTIACNLRFGRRFIRNHCSEDDIDFDQIDDYNPKQLEKSGRPYIPESAISRSVHCYTHWRMQLKCMYMQGDHPFRENNRTNWDGIFGSRLRRRLMQPEEEESEPESDEEEEERHHHYHHRYRRHPSSRMHSSQHYHHHQTTRIVEERERQHRQQQRPPPNSKGQRQRQQQNKQKRPTRSSSSSSSRYHRRPNDYLVNLRSPLDRIASWFVYEHTENHGSIYPDRPYHCGQLVLSSCYKHFEHLTTVGLSGPQPDPNQPLRVGTNLSATECSHWAWATVQGNMPADYHNAYNYDWYAHRLLYEPRNANADVFVLRVEHLEQDWTTVDKMLGGTGHFPLTLKKKQNDASIKPLRIAHKNTTDIGMQNLCRALCNEIQVYKAFLLRAINLQQEDLDISMEELRQQCPEEVDIQARICPSA